MESESFSPFFNYKKIHELNYIYLSKLWYMYVHIRIMKQRVMFGNEGDIKCKAVN